MRFALRKQDKIKAVLGKEYLENNILQSLNKYFENSDNDRIYSDIEPDGYVNIVLWMMTKKEPTAAQMDI